MNDVVYALNEVKRISESINEKSILIDTLHSRLMPAAVSYDNVKVQTSPTDRMLEAVALLDEAERELDDLVKSKMAQAVMNVMGIINMLDKSIERQVFILWYIDLYDAGKIAKQMNYTPDGVYKIHRKGIAFLKSKLN